MRFEFATATRIIFGQGSFEEIPDHASKLGTSACIVLGKTQERAEPLLKGLREKGIETTLVFIAQEPTTTLALEAVQTARAHQCDFVISMGGGSVLDLGKVVAALLTNQGEFMDYLEVIGKGMPLSHAAAPHIAVPTTAGTGAEVTRNSVLDSPEYRVKVSMRSPLMLPTLAVVDPLLTLSMPAELTASTGLDAFTQLIEAYVCNQANPLTDGICIEGIKRAARSLQKACESGSDVDAREDMAIASLFGGLALANAKLGAVHGFSGTLGGMYPMPHGVICAQLLPHVMESNLLALQQRMPNSDAQTRYKEVAQIITGSFDAEATDGVLWVKKLCSQLPIPELSSYGLNSKDFPKIIKQSKKSSSMKGNPIALSDPELLEILNNVL